MEAALASRQCETPLQVEGATPEGSMSRNYERPRVDPHKADSRNTHPVVLAAIHAIADSSRSAEAPMQA
ncbi:MAG: hypothetical protein WAL40_09700, partial [Rhodoplanes sp.]